MPLSASSLSAAVHGIAEFLDGKFGEEVSISVDTPQKANERVKGSDKHFLNIFIYRVSPSGFHAGATAKEPFFIRVNALLTPFIGNVDKHNPDADLRILGHAIRVLASEPVLPGVLPGPVPPPPADDSGGDSDSTPPPAPPDPPDFREQPHLDYRIQAVLQTPTMEELNHIWTTQGGELAYRLSAAYEFALIPIEPLERSEPPATMTTAIVDAKPDLDGATVSGVIPLDDDTSAIAVGGIGPDSPPPPASWLPVLMLVDGAALANSLDVEPDTPTVKVALAGPPGERVALEVRWKRENGSVETQDPQAFEIESHLLEDANARVDLALANAKQGDAAIIHTRLADGDGKPISTSPFANTLTLTVGGTS